MIRYAACVALAFVSILHAGPPHPAAEAAPDVFFPIPQDEQRLAGVAAMRMRSNTEGYLEHVDARALLADPVSAGLFLGAAADSHEYSEDAQLEKVMDRVAQAIIKTPPRTEDGRAQASLIAGLVAFGEETGQEDALAVARKVADSAITQASPMLIGPLVNLYRATDEDRYLQAAQSLVRKNAPSNDIDRFLFFSGLVSYYRQSGDDAALKKSVQAWHAVHPTVTGAPDSEGDTTLTAIWFEWTKDLLRITGQIEYADALETTLYNQLLAAQEPQTGAVFESVTSGQKQRSSGVSPCAAAEAWALADLPEAFWGRMNNAIVLFNYSPGRASVRLRRRTRVQIYAEGNYPQTGELTLHVEPSRETRFHLQLRVPRWSRKFTVESGETRLIGKPGEFVNLSRNWKKGDTVHITIDRPVFEVTDPAKPGVVALQRGPQVLAVTSDTLRGAKDMNSIAWTNDSRTSTKDAHAPTGSPESMFEQVFQTTGVINGANEKLLLLPFADAISPYRIWLPKR